MPSIKIMKRIKVRTMERNLIHLVSDAKRIPFEVHNFFLRHFKIFLRMEIQKKGSEMKKKNFFRSFLKSWVEWIWKLRGDGHFFRQFVGNLWQFIFGSFDNFGKNLSLKLLKMVRWPLGIPTAFYRLKLDSKIIYIFVMVIFKWSCLSVKMQWNNKFIQEHFTFFE